MDKVKIKIIGEAMKGGRIIQTINALNQFVKKRI